MKNFLQRYWKIIIYTFVFSGAILIILGVGGPPYSIIIPLKNNRASTTPISKPSFSNDPINIEDLVITYNFKGSEKRYISTGAGYADGVDAKFYDFNGDHQNELYIILPVGNHAARSFIYSIDERGDLHPVCASDYRSSELPSLENESEAPLIEICSFTSDAPLIYVMDTNQDNSLDLIVGFRDYNSDPVHATLFRIYTWDKTTQKFKRI